MIKLPSRQVHLDFHTSELIPDIGRDFDKAQWQAALRAGHVDSITVFAKCHHSWSYYPTQIGKPHPHLKRDLLGEQIAACHEIGIRAPIYYTVGWSATDAETHPEWCVRQADGTIATCNYDVKAQPTDAKPNFSWKFMCPNGEYRRLIVAQTKEICERYPVDGFFYDICHHVACYCDTCRQEMQRLGMSPERADDVAKYHIIRWQRLMTECNAVIQAAHPAATIFYNGGGGNQYQPEWHAWQTHHELEDLPTSWGGYDKFPTRAKYFANTPKQYLAMSGKFHSAWGEFGGFKHPDAIKFEAACMIAYGARCSFGDQLHPSGAMDRCTYENIGHAYAYVEQIAEYGLDGQPAANLGIWLGGNENEDQGLAKMLMENQLDFLVVDPQQDLARYATIILPGTPFLDATSQAKLTDYLAKGGSVLALGTSCLDKEKTRFLLDVGATYLGPATYENDYLVVGRELTGGGIVTTPFLNYTGALRVKLTDGQSLARIKEPYFNRTYGTYCSHQNTPNRLEDAAHPGAWRKGQLVYLPHPLADLYYQHGARMHRQFFTNALALIYTNPLVATELPSAGRVNLIHQPAHRRYVAHLMYGSPMLRGRCQVIEDLPTLHNIPVTLAVPESITRAYLAPAKQAVSLQTSGKKVRAMIPSFAGHVAVVFEY